MWQHLCGTAAYKAGTSGTVTLPSGAILIAIVAHASTGGATVSIFGGDNIPIVNGAPPFVLDFKHTLFQASGSSTAAQIVMTSTDSYMIHYVRQGNAS